MSNKSDYLRNQILREVAGIAAFAAPATWHIALYTAAPTSAGGGTECTGGGYARRSVTANGTNFSVTTNVLTNLTEMAFGLLSGSIGTTLAFGIFDASTGGNLLYFGALAAPDQKTYIAGDQPIIPVGALTVTET